MQGVQVDERSEHHVRPSPIPTLHHPPDLFQRFWQELALPQGATRPPLSADEVECMMRDRVALVDGG